MRRHLLAAAFALTAAPSRAQTLESALLGASLAPGGRPVASGKLYSQGLAAAGLSCGRHEFFSWAVSWAVQRRLLDLGHREVGEADGLSGPRTRGVVRRFQGANALSANGVVGPNIWSRPFGVRLRRG